MEDAWKRASQIKIGDEEYLLSDHDTHKNDIIKELKSVEYDDLEGTVFRSELTYWEIEYILDMKYFDSSCTRYTLETGLCGTSDINFILKSLLADDVVKMM